MEKVLIDKLEPIVAKDIYNIQVLAKKIENEENLDNVFFIFAEEEIEKINKLIIQKTKQDRQKMKGQLAKLQSCEMSFQDFLKANKNEALKDINFKD